MEPDELDPEEPEPDFEEPEEFPEVPEPEVSEDALLDAEALADAAAEEPDADCVPVDVPSVVRGASALKF
jgi:hypothetical protein